MFTHLKFVAEIHRVLKENRKILGSLTKQTYHQQQSFCVVCCIDNNI